MLFKRISHAQHDGSLTSVDVNECRTGRTIRYHLGAKMSGQVVRQPISTSSVQEIRNRREHFSTVSKYLETTRFVHAPTLETTVLETDDTNEGSGK